MEPVTLLTWRVPHADADAIEAAALPERDLEARLRAAGELLGATGLAYVATCQRVTWVLQDAPDDAGRALVDAYASLWGRTLTPPEEHAGFDAFRHLCTVASSLDALVPGEPQVLGQVKAAVQRCDEAGLLGTDLRHVFNHVFQTAKQVRSQTALFQGKVSLVPLTEQLMREALATWPAPHVAVLGTGQMGEQALRLIRRISDGVEVTVVSRNRLRAHEFAAQHDAAGRTLDAFLADPPPSLGLVVCAMRTEAPLLSAAWLEARARSRGLTVLDLALPRNTQAPRDPRGLRLVQMDDLTRMSEQARQGREAAYDDAVRILDDAVDRVRHEYDLRCHASTLHRLTQRFQAVAEERWSRMDGADPADPRTRKWYDQTVRALLHEATRVVKEPGETA